MVGFMVGGAFLSLAYYDYFYYVIAALMITQKVLTAQRTPAVQKQPVKAPMVRKAGTALTTEKIHAR